MSSRVSGSRLTSESCSDRKKTCSTLVSVVRWHTVWLKTTKCWPPVNLITDWIKLSRLSHFGFKSTHATKSSWKFLLPKFRDDSGGVVSFKVSAEEETPWKWLTIVRSSFLESFHTHYRQQTREVLLPHTLRQTGTRTRKFSHPPKKVVLKFLELSLSTMPPSLSLVWVPRIVVLKHNSWQTYVVLNSTHCNQGRSWPWVDSTNHSDPPWTSVRHEEVDWNSM
jgi:hypothetical protein